MGHVLAIRRETKSPWERRAAITPQLARRLISGSDVDVWVQPSARRVFRDKEYVRAGASMTSDLSDAGVVVGVKEIPIEALHPETTYLFFAHVIKGQKQNMPMLRRLLELGCTLIDYERMVDDDGRRLVFFGRFAGLAGMIDTLWALGQRLIEEGHHTPFAAIEPAHAYDSLADARDAVRAAGERVLSEGLPPTVVPLVIGVAGYGNVARGVREILSELPTRDVSPQHLLDVTPEGFTSGLLRTTFREEDTVSPRDAGRSFELQDYYDRPEGYVANFARFLPHLNVLMNCNYWDERYPRLVQRQDISQLWSGGSAPRLRVIGDLGCDVGGAIECTVRCTEPGDPVYVFQPADGTAPSGVEGDGPVILAVDILPSELPREASEEFAASLSPFLPAVARADYTVPLDDLRLPPEIRRAVIVYRGELTPEYRHLERHLEG